MRKGITKGGNIERGDVAVGCQLTPLGELPYKTNEGVRRMQVKEILSHVGAS